MYSKIKVLLTIVVVLLIGLFMAMVVYAGDPDSNEDPASTESYSLEDIYNRLNDGTAGTKKAFTEPSSGPPSGATGTGHTLDEIMVVAPALDNSTGATPTQVMSGTTYWGLRDGAWGLQTGALAIQTVDNSTVNQIAGYYNPFDLSVVDTDLGAGNIKRGVNLFGVDGTGPIAYTYTLGVPKTGQTTSYDTRDDGQLQMGVAWPVPRFITGTTGIVTDTLTGLIWLENGYCATFFSGDGTGENARSWSNALTAANSLANGYCGLTDGSSAGNWRLPNRFELESLLHLGVGDGFTVAVPNTAGTGQWTWGDPFTDVRTNYYWSSSTLVYDSSKAWRMTMNNGLVNFYVKTSSWYVWPVRGGQ